MRKLATLLVLGFLSACNAHPLLEPKPVFLDTEIPYGPVEFREGYNDGCESALAAYGNSAQKSYYGLSKNPRYETNRIYNQIWKDGWAYCYMWLYVHNRGDKAIRRSPL